MCEGVRANGEDLAVPIGEEAGRRRGGGLVFV